MRCHFKNEKVLFDRGRKLLLIIAFTFLLTPFLQAQEYSLGIITDYEQSVAVDSILKKLVNQLDKTVGSTANIRLDEGNISYKNENKALAASNYTKLAERTKIIILIGATSVSGVYDQGQFLVPTFGIGVVDPVIQGLPIVEGKSGIPNFTYIWETSGLETTLLAFKQLIRFQHLAILANPGTPVFTNTDSGDETMSALAAKLDSDIQTIEVGTDLVKSIEQLNKDVDAVYISDIGMRSEDEIQQLADWLIERKLPSFASQTSYISQGILACLSNDDSFSQVSRKLGVMVDEYLFGVPLEDMQVKTVYREKLFINEETANTIQLNLPLSVLFTAETVKINKGLPTYTIADVLELGLKNNLNIIMSKQDIELAIQEVRSARSAVLPNLDLSVNGRQINTESANALADNPERLVNGQLQLDQVIFSQQAFSGIKIAKYLQKAQEFATESEIQDIVFTVFNDYLNVLSAKSVLMINKENLEILEVNLNIARLQVESGGLSISELYRWQSEVALAKQENVVASTNLLELKNVMNNRMAFSLEKDYDIEDIAIDDEVFKIFRNSIISEYVNTTRDISLVSDFLVEMATLSNPKSSYILEQIKAQESQRKLNKSLFYLPNVGLQAQTSQVLLRDGAGSTPTSGNSYNNNTWNIGIGIAYPIFTGTERKTNLRKSTIQLDQLNNSKLSIQNDLELAVRSSLFQSVAATTNLEYSKIASKNALENFGLIQLRYAEGDIDITQMIDAQRTAIQAKLRSMVSVYDYLRSQIQLQYAVGYFPMMASENTKQDFRNKFITFINENTSEK